MEDNKHTSGIWIPSGQDPVFNPMGTYQMAIGHAETKDITAFAFGKTSEECEANAVLISASPLMYSYISEKAKEGDQFAQKIIRIINNGRQ